MKTFHDCYFISLQSLEKFIVLVVDFFSVSCDLPVTKKVFFVIGVTRQLNHHKKSFYTKSAKFKYQTLWQNAKISGFQPTKITDIPVVAVSWRIESAAESLSRSRGCGVWTLWGHPGGTLQGGTPNFLKATHDTHVLPPASHFQNDAMQQQKNRRRFERAFHANARKG